MAVKDNGIIWRQVLFVIAFFSGCWLGAAALPCFTHDHCGEHAVCISAGLGRTPRCECLVGFIGNGAKCERIDSFPSKSIAKVDQLVLQKGGCSQRISSEETGPPAIRPKAGNNSKPKSEENSAQTRGPLASVQRKRRPAEVPSKEADAVLESIKLGTTSRANADLLFITPPPIKRNSNGKECEKVVCNFDIDSCRYRSLGETNWSRKTKGAFGSSKNAASGHVAVTKPGGSLDQFLATENFVLFEQAELRFEYFENDQSSHLQLCDRDLSHCFWQSAGANGKWTDGSVVLPSGTHRLIFVASDLGTGLVAIDDIRLENDGQPAQCV